MNGILIINKEKNCTSRDIVNELRNIFHIKEIGHTGTSDPIATGVLVVCIGKYTKLVNEITSLEKEYVVTCKFGIKTDTLDITGNVLDEDNKQIEKEDVIKALEYFNKEYLQTVPIYSAVKINGKKLYEYAREGKTVDLPKRLVNIYNIELISFKDNELKFKALVSKGTYIRSLVNDIANYLETYAVMTDLQRTKQGKFFLEDAYTTDDIKNNNYEFYPLEKVFNYEKIYDSDNLVLYRNGGKVEKNIKDGKYFICDKDIIIAIYEFSDGLGKPYIMLV